MFKIKDLKNYTADYFIKIQEINRRSQNKKLGALVKTYGCQQNVSDSEKICGMLEKMGYSIVKKECDADIIVINTCAIREHAENRILGNIGALKNIKKDNPDLLIAVCGCMTEQEEAIQKIKKSYPFVDLVFGTHSMSRFPEFIYDVLTNKKRFFINNDNDEKIYEDIPVKRDGKIKAFIPIMYGCNNFCSYCIVPHVRGRERSRGPDAVIEEFKMLLDNGYKEIMLLGQNVNSYGEKLEEKINFAELLRRLDNFNGEYRIRFMTSHPKDATKELIDTIAEGKHICHNIHLPFQSGNNAILKAMNRKYTVEQYLDIIDYAKKKIKDLSLSSDVIVGFPGETYDEFKDTVSLIKKVEFISLFTFIYSKRKGTPAAVIEDLVSREEKTKWLTELLKVQDEISDRLNKHAIGKTFRALVEEAVVDKGKLLSRTSNNLIVELEGDKSLVGTFVDVEITNSLGKSLKGEII